MTEEIQITGVQQLRDLPDHKLGCRELQSLMCWVLLCSECDNSQLEIKTPQTQSPINSHHVEYSRVTEEIGPGRLPSYR